MRWIEFSVEVDGESAEAVSDLFHRYGHGGVAVEELEPPEELLIGPQSLRTDRAVRVATYVPEDGDSAAIRERLHDSLGYLSMIRPMKELQEKVVAEEEWASAWKDHFHPHRAGERTVIVPTWREYEPVEGDIVIQLDPGMAFGTGLHPTTRLCLRELESMVTPGMTILDVGTGSGILSLTAAKLGAARALGLDIDPVAVAAARENVSLNDLASVIEIQEGSLPRDGQDPWGRAREGWPEEGFDLVVANVTADVLAELAQPLSQALRPGGMLIGSGIISERFTEAAYALMGVGLRLVDAVSEGDWRAVVMMRLEGEA